MPNTVKTETGSPDRSRQLRYAVLKRGKNGFAEVDRLTEDPPSGEPYVRVHNVYRRYELYGNRRTDTAQYHFSFPFQRFYLNENLAPEAELLARGYHSEKSGGLRPFRPGLCRWKICGAGSSDSRTPPAGSAPPAEVMSLEELPIP